MENKSKPLTEGKIKTNVKNTTEYIRAAPPPPPLPKHKTVENKTAVEWLIDRYEEKIGKSITHIMEAEIEYAKRMEREQIQEAYEHGEMDSTAWHLEQNREYNGSSDYFTKTYQNGENS